MLDDKKICFIYAGKDEQVAAEAARYVGELLIPEGYTFETRFVPNESDLAAAYQKAMESSSAKYKLYIQEQVFVLKKDLIGEVVQLFQENPELGMLGVVGSKSIPLAGSARGISAVGCFCEQQQDKVVVKQFGSMDCRYELVKAIDGLFLATQYDIPWTRQMSMDDRLVSIGQSFEFAKLGYKLAVAQQNKPWFLVEGIEENPVSDQSIKKLFNNYSKDLALPLVSILIPTYNRPDYFEQALQSALSQTYPNIEVVIGDDSTNDDTEELIKRKYAGYANIRYYRNAQNLGQFHNDLMLFDLSEGEYVNFLMDDDLFHPQKIAKMMAYYLEDHEKEITLVTSHRQVIDDDGNHLSNVGVVTQLWDEDQILEGVSLGNLVLENNFNCIGEPTTVLFRKSDLNVPFGTFCGREYGCNVDMATWLNLMANGKAVFIAERLSFFRIHKGQQQHSINMILNGYTDFAHEVLHAPTRGYLQDPKQYLHALEKAINLSNQLLEYLSDVKSKTERHLELESYQGMLLEKYEQAKKVVYPLVSVLIPAYNRPHYLSLALQSVLDQTYPNIEIIICDDSTNDEVQEMIQSYLHEHPNIRYFKNEKNLALGNAKKCLALARGEYINFLMDDDLFHPDKISTMIQYFMDDQEITMVTSYRKMIDEDGNTLPDNPMNTKLFDTTRVINGKSIGNYMLKKCMNAIGEPTTVLFRKKDLNENIYEYKGKEYWCLSDLASWLVLMSKGKVAYISEPLSYFRQHSGQNQRRADIQAISINEWFRIIKDSREDGFLSIEADYKFALNNFMKLASNLTTEAINNFGIDFLKSDVMVTTLKEWVDELTTSEDHYYCPLCNNRTREFLPWPDLYDFPGYEFEMANKYSAICPSCSSMDRERLFKYYIENETDLLNITDSKVLHVAPEKNLMNWLKRFKNIQYVCGDLYPQDQSIEKLDITNIVYPDDYFDVIFCSHVLEHVVDDVKAMKEFYRVMKKGGWGILQVPICVSIDSTYEDPSIVTPEDRKKAFGQDDHVRIYEKTDYIKRLESVGFVVELYNLSDKHGEQMASKLGMGMNDPLYLVKKRG